MSGHGPSKLPWSGSLSVDLSRGALSVSADGLAVIDAQHVCWAIVFPDVYGGYDHAANLVDAVNSHATNEAKIEALAEALKLSVDLMIIMGRVYNASDAPALELTLEKALAALQTAAGERE